MSAEHVIALANEIQDARLAVARAVSPVVVTTIEAMGYRIVPQWMLTMLHQITEKVGAENESEGRDG